MFRRLSLLFALPVLLSACSPTDQNIYSYKERLESGKPILYNQKGEINKGCRSAWSDVRMTEEQIENLSFISTYPVTAFGSNNCFEVGSVIAITDKDSRSSLRIKARVRGVALWNSKGPQATRKTYSDFVKWAIPPQQGVPEKMKPVLETYINNLFNTEVMTTASKSDDGIINVTHIDLLRNGQDESGFAEKGRERFEQSLSYYDETTAGEPLLKNCGQEDWSQSGFRVSEEQWQLIQKLNAGNDQRETRSLWYVWGGKSACLSQGATVALIDQKTRETLGSFKVEQVREMTQNLVEKNLNSQPLKLAPGMTPEDVFKDIQSQFQKKAGRTDAHLFVVEFSQFQGGGN